MNLRFTKYKNTNSIFYTRSNNLRVDIDLLIGEVVVVSPNFSFMGKYKILAEVAENSESIQYLVVELSIFERMADKDITIQDLKLIGADMYLNVTKDYRKVMLVRGDMSGIIMKN